MKNAAKTTTARCSLCGRYFFRTYRTRPPKYCIDCAQHASKENNKLRQRAFRKRRKQEKTPPSKRRRAEMPRPVPDGYREETERSTPKREVKGLYSELPEPDRTNKRKRIGLP
jgi:hypothetical protein